jgi:hypothetical protein
MQHYLFEFSIVEQMHQFDLICGRNTLKFSSISQVDSVVYHHFLP